MYRARERERERKCAKQVKPKLGAGIAAFVINEVRS